MGGSSGRHARTRCLVIRDHWHPRHVIGTGPTGVAFVEQALANNPRARILVLERGRFWLPVHYQMLPAAFSAT